MGHIAGPVLNLISDISKIGADRLLIHSTVTAPTYYLGNREVEAASERTKFVPIQADALTETLRILAGHEMVNDFFNSITPENRNRSGAVVRETVAKHEGEYFRVNFAMNRGHLMAHFLKLDSDPRSKWEAKLEKISADFIGGTHLILGNRYGSADIELGANQLIKLKAFLLELEKDNIAPAESE